MRAVIRMLLGVLAWAAVAALVPDLEGWRAVVHGAAGPGRVDELAVVLATAALWLLAVWVLVAVLAASLASLPGGAGRLGRALVGVCVPRVLRGVVLSGVAGGLVLGPGVAATAVPVWPTTPPATASPTPGPAWPTAPRPGSTPAPTPAPTRDPSAGSSAGSGPTSTAAVAVVVVPGDSLWSISAGALTRAGTEPTAARVAATWPSWYAANRAAIGPDPGLLTPGTPLTPPTTDGSTS